MQHTVANATNTSSGPAVVPEQFLGAVALLQKKAPMTVMSSGLPTCISAASTGLNFAKCYIGGFYENLSRYYKHGYEIRHLALRQTCICVGDSSA
jgi:hypothetical protein